MNVYLKEAHRISESSLDPSTKVGVVIVYKRLIMGEGFNHLAPGTPDTYWEDRLLKYRHVIHAETKAILTAGQFCVDSTLYVTHHICRDCALLAAASFIKKVICPGEPWRDTPDVKNNCDEAKLILERAGIEVAYV